MDVKHKEGFKAYATPGIYFVCRVLKSNFQYLEAYASPLQDHINESVKDVQGHLENGPGKTDKTLEVNKQPQPFKEKIQEPDDMAEDVKAVQSKCKEVYKNNKGFWEADYGDGIIMVYIPPGEFTMGSNDYDNEKPPHTVFLDGYWMGKTEVTVKQFGIFVEDEKGGEAYTRTGEKWEQKEGTTWKDPGFKQDDNHPVVCVSWNDVRAYCKWLSYKKGLLFKLPTEAQWEKAARGTDSRKYPWGNKEPDETLANFDKKIGKTSPVGSYPEGPSPYGLLDMAGNVWEWCNDWYEIDYYKRSPTKNPLGPESSSKKVRVQRSGCWDYDAGYLRCAFRGKGTPSLFFNIVGFRLCQDNH
jgi:formylglycine-generating enzyme required for sulfatase activity